MCRYRIAVFVVTPIETMMAWTMGEKLRPTMNCARACSYRTENTRRFPPFVNPRSLPGYIYTL